MYIYIFHALISSFFLGGGVFFYARIQKKNPDGEGEGPKDDSVWRGVRYLLSEILLLELNKVEFSTPPYIRTCTCGINDKENKIP